MRRIGAELQEMESSEKDGMDNSKMESIRGLLVYMSRTYWDMNPYLKGLHLTLDSWIPLRDKEGWWIRG